MAKRITLTTLVLALVIGYAGIALAVSSYATSFKSTYPSSPLSSLSTVSGQAGNLCTVCHGTSGGSRNAYGSAYSSNGHSFSAIQNLDSDNDGFTNLAEITAGTFPGNASSTPGAAACTGYTYSAWSTCGANGQQTRTVTGNTPANCTGTPATQPVLTQACTPPPTGDTTAPVVTAFSIPATSSSLTVSISTLTATDTVGVTGYLVNESSTRPSASAAGWSASKPASYTFGSEGGKTLYAWAKDAAGNVSNSLSANVTITISTSDATPPAITVFDLPAVIYSLKVPIIALQATDNLGVTGYIVKKSSLKPSVADAGWRSAPPASVTLPDAGAKTLYAWAKDAAGNISDMASMTVVARLSADPGPIPVPTSQETFAYSAVPHPAERGNLAKAKPLGIGALREGGSFDLQASIGPFSGPVDIYVTMYAPEAAGSIEPLAVYYLRPDNSFAAIATVPEPWQQGVIDINEHIMDIPAGDLVPGPYILVMTVTAAGSRSDYYKWSTSFIVP